MNQEHDLDTNEKRVAYLMNSIPAARHSNLYLILSYWQVFNDIDIPEGLLQELAGSATQPETITRARRKVLEQHRIRRYLELQRTVLDEE